ncbi:MAG: glycosyltransferase family 2 protein, partial [Planktomarina sp.]
SLSVAMYRAGLKWKELPENEHYIMGGMLRGQPLPADMDVKTVHYRQWPVLVDSNMEHIGYDALKSQINTTRVKWVHDQPLPPGIDPLPVAGQSHTIPSDGSAPHIIQQTPKGAEGKSGCAAMTMVHQDHVFLERWVDYYSKQLGRENLYVLRHGDDPEVDRIAAGATIINVPRLDNLDTFDEQRWAMLSSFATGLTIYYNWVLCTDVDEIVAVDPDVCWNLAAYLDDKLNEDPAPNLIAPFPIEVVHTPATEQSAIIPGANILEVRRNFRVAPRRAKHCIVGRKITFSGDGVGSNVNSNVLDPNLFLFHLGSFDTDICKQRNAERQNKDARPDTSNGLEPLETRSNFPELVTQMQQGYRQDSAGNWRFGDVTASDLYRLPDRFRTLF